MPQRNYEKALSAVMNELSESVAAASEADLLEDARAAQQDPEAIAETLRARMLDTMKSFRQETLRAARKDYEDHIAAFAQSQMRLPTTPAARRSLFEVLSRRADLVDRLTVQFRDLGNLSDQDVESCLRQLQMLGLLDEGKND